LGRCVGRSAIVDRHMAPDAATSSCGSNGLLTKSVIPADPACRRSLVRAAVVSAAIGKRVGPRLWTGRVAS
jgi:hypothetical protein